MVGSEPRVRRGVTAAVPNGVTPSVRSRVTERGAPSRPARRAGRVS